MTDRFEKYGQASDAASLAFQEGKFDVAFQHLTTCLDIDYQNGQILRRMGECAVMLQQPDVAKEAYLRALAFDPHDTRVLAGVASAAQQLGQLQDADYWFRRTLAISPEFPAAKWNHSLVRLALGDYSAETWELYRAGIQMGTRPHRTTTYPLTPDVLGLYADDLHEYNLYIYGEQGFGDMLMLLRFVPAIAKKFNRVTLEVPPEMLPLMWSQPQDEKGKVFGCDHITAPCYDAGFAADADYYVSIFELPGLLLGDIDDLSQFPAPYLTVQPNPVVEQWAAQIPEGKLRVGVCWKGSKGHGNDQHRSLQAEDFAFIGGIGNVYAVSLIPGEHPPYCAGRFDAQHWEHTAAVLSHLDVVLTVDTAVAHLAGAMGKKVYLLLAYAHDWRWCAKYPNDSPWYGNTELFRQQQQGEWDKPLSEVQTVIHGEAGGAMVYTCAPKPKDTGSVTMGTPNPFNFEMLFDGKAIP